VLIFAGFFARTALESPAFPTIISSLVMIAEQAVHPVYIAILSVAFYKIASGGVSPTFL
jgi:hypothetical protein